MKKIHFIAGLDRAGSTVLNAILNQNPRFTASIIRSPMEDLCRKVVRCTSSEFEPMLRKKSPVLIKSLFDTYYANTEVVFDTNRAWMLRDDLLRDLFPDHKMILCVRSIPEILNSFEIQHRKNPYVLTAMYGEDYGKNVQTRCAVLMAQNGGAVCEPLQALSQYLAASDGRHLIVEYNDLAKNPAGTMKVIYDHLGEEYFAHDFNNVQVPDRAMLEEYDTGLRTYGLHAIRPKVEYLPEPMVLPKGIVQQYSGLEFWREKVDA